MNLPKLSEIDVKGKKVLVRMDLDVSKDSDFRLKVQIPTLVHLAQNHAKVIIIGHKGRPGGKPNKKDSLKPISKTIEKLLGEEIGEDKMKDLDMSVMENLRFNPGEEENDAHFTKHLAENTDVFINEAFGDSHRKHASIVGLPELLPSAFGKRFMKEVENLSKIIGSPKKPVIAVISGVKKDKVDYIEPIKKITDLVLVAGRLPEFLPEDTYDTKLVVAHLSQDKEDITMHSIERFEKEIVRAETIILSGPVGKFEDEGHNQGTKRVFESIANSKALKYAGGGDTQRAINLLGLDDKFDWISVGGGAMLEFLVKGTLPGIEAIRNN